MSMIRRRLEMDKLRFERESLIHANTELCAQVDILRKEIARLLWEAQELRGENAMLGGWVNAHLQDSMAATKRQHEARVLPFRPRRPPAA